MSENFVSAPPSDVILALQYWPGDELRAMRMARLLADLEPRRRKGVTLAFFRRFDMTTESAALWETRLHCGFKFSTMALRARREGEGHPRGCNELAASVLGQLSGAWRDGNLSAHSVFLLEADGVPLRRDWLDIVLAEHVRTLEDGKRVTGALTNHGARHINGSMLAHLSLWHDRPSLHSTPADQAWDMMHAQVLLSEARPTPWIKNVYAEGAWSDASLAGMAKETAWLASSKDDSALEWAERTLVPRAAAKEGTMAKVTCRACGAVLLPENENVADGCPCNSARGVNHGLVPTRTCTCKVCDPAQTGSARGADRRVTVKG